jgi:hypothetical protein
MQVHDEMRGLLKSSSAKATKKLAWLRHGLQAKIDALLQRCPAGLSTLGDTITSLPVEMSSSNVTDDEESDGDDIADLDSDGSEDGECGPDVNIHPELVKLPLPSHVGIRLCRELGLSQIASQEVELRKGQAHECLHQLKLALGLKSALFRKTIRLPKSQKTKTRSRTAVRNIEAGVRLHVRRYNAARQALVSLGCSEQDLKEFQVIRKEDLKISRDITEENRFGQRSDSIAWFWRVKGGSSNDTWQDEGK